MVTVKPIPRRNFASSIWIEVKRRSARAKAGRREAEECERGASRDFLQTSGRPGFLIRATLAATLSGLGGMYSGLICEAAALPGHGGIFQLGEIEISARL